MRNTFLVTGLLIAVAACSDTGDDAVGDDAIGDDTTGDDTIGDDTTGDDAPADVLAIVDSSPADGEAEVTPLSDLAVTLSGPIDPASLDGVTAALWIERAAPAPRLDPDALAEPPLINTPWPTTLSWDAATSTIHVVPLVALPVNAQCRLALHGIRDPDGNTLRGSVRFSTQHQWLHKVTSYGAGGGITGYELLADPLAEESVEVSYGAPGADGIWGTSDDVRTRVRTRRRPSPDLETLTSAYAPGPDGAWFTADDELDEVTRTTFDAAGLPRLAVRSDAPGPDGDWLTADDPADGWIVSTRDPQDHLSYECVFFDAGADGVVGTADDRRAGPADPACVRYSYDGDGRPLVTQVMTAGPDARWWTADDQAVTSIANRYDPDGLVGMRIYHDGPLPSPFVFVENVVRNAERQPIEQQEIEAPGADGVWATDDDVLAGVTAFTPLAKQLATQTRSYRGPGPDGAWRTADDVGRFFLATTYEDGGGRVRAYESLGAGPDGELFTADDPRGPDYAFRTPIFAP